MNILIIGSGGREHAFAWKLKQSALCSQLYISPGNAGTAQCGINLNIGISDFENLATAALHNKIDLILVGPEEPLVKGITDFFKNDAATSHIKIIGPGKEAAQLEGSKAFAKDFMRRHGVPTAGYREFTEQNFEEGIAYIKQHTLPIVLKADGLAAGKGVLILAETEDALGEFELMIRQSKFGAAGSRVVIEEFLHGIEMSVFVLTDGKNYLLLPEAKDYKRIGEGDTGLNTGGMGAVSPVPIMTPALKDKIIEKIIKPSVRGLQKDNYDYKGFLFIGLMINDGEPYVIEYNCRMGDPETEVVIPRIKNDFVQLLDATATGGLDEITLETDERSVVGIVAVSGGYPGEFKKGELINGLNDAEWTDSILFHSGTLQKENEVVTNGGRVLVAISFTGNITDAAKKSADMLKNISFSNMQFRKDIGYEFQ